MKRKLSVKILSGVRHNVTDVKWNISIQTFELGILAEFCENFDWSLEMARLKSSDYFRRLSVVPWIAFCSRVQTCMSALQHATHACVLHCAHACTHDVVGPLDSAQTNRMIQHGEALNTHDCTHARHAVTNVGPSTHSAFPTLGA